MIRPDRFVYDKEIISKILDICEIVTVGFQDKYCPYLVPMNYGHFYDEEKLYIFVHSSKEGYKQKLIKENPLVCLSFFAWRNFPDRPHKGHYHDFRSVMAFGNIRKVIQKEEPDFFKKGLKAIFDNYDRKGCVNPKGIKAIDLFVVECDWEDVSGKTETPVRKPEDVPFPDVYNIPKDEVPYDITDLIEEREDEIKNKKYLGYLED